MPPLLCFTIKPNFSFLTANTANMNIISDFPHLHISLEGN